MVLIGKKFKTSTGYMVEVFKITGSVLSCYQLNEYAERISEKKLLGDGYKVCIINKDKIIEEI